MVLLKELNLKLPKFQNSTQIYKKATVYEDSRPFELIFKNPISFIFEFQKQVSRETLAHIHKLIVDTNIHIDSYNCIAENHIKTNFKNATERELKAAEALKRLIDINIKELNNLI